MKTRRTSASELYARLVNGKTHTARPGTGPGEVLIEPFGLDQRWTLSDQEYKRLNDLLSQHGKGELKAA